MNILLHNEHIYCKKSQNAFMILTEKGVTIFTTLPLVLIYYILTPLWVIAKLAYQRNRTYAPEQTVFRGNKRPREEFKSWQQDLRAVCIPIEGRTDMECVVILKGDTVVGTEVVPVMSEDMDLTSPQQHHTRSEPFHTLDEPTRRTEKEEVLD